MVSDDIHLEIGLLAFEGLDQADLTGPFEVLARLPNCTTRIYAKTLDPVRDVKGLRLLPDATLAEAPQLDVLHVPGGYGQEASCMTSDARMGAAPGRWRTIYSVGVHGRADLRRRRAPDRAPGDDALVRLASAAAFWRRSGRANAL